MWICRSTLLQSELCWRPLRDEYSGQTLEVRFRGRILRMLFYMAPEVRDWRAGENGWRSQRFLLERRGSWHMKGIWLMKAGGQDCRVLGAYKEESKMWDAIDLPLCGLSIPHRRWLWSKGKVNQASGAAPAQSKAYYISSPIPQVRRDDKHL